MNSVNKLLLASIIALVGISSSAQQLAFPEAQGWGRFAMGGRGGSVYHVTNLNDSGSGSLRDAVSQPNRIVVFDVSGVIKISSRMGFAKNLYVAGQTAPGEGIIVYGDGVTFTGSDNIIVRYVKFRMGKGGTSGKDAAGIANGKNMIFDHCSFSWGLDETFSINWDSKGTAPQMITLQNCIIGQGLLSHSAGGLMQADSITLYRNLYVDNSTRNNKVKGTNQYVNNIVYNWKDGCYLMGGDSQGTSHVHINGNLFINGPSGGGNAITSGNADFHVYATDNWQDKNRDGVLNPYEIPRGEYSGGPTFHDAPFGYPALEMWKATELVERLLPEVGASLPYRDPADYLMIHQVKSFGKEGAIISSESQLSVGAPTSWSLATFTKPADSDGDGMPDEWERANGTDVQKNDAMTLAANGYANIENYINSISRESIPVVLRSPEQLKAASSTDTSITLEWMDFTEGEDAFVVEQGGKEIARVEAGKERYVVTGLQAGTSYQFAVKAVKGDKTSANATLTAKTQPKYVEMVDVDNYEADFSWSGNTMGYWNTTQDCWYEGLYADGSKVLIETDKTTNVLLNETVSPASVVVNNTEGTTVSIKVLGTAKGTIAGDGSVNKTGAGTLAVTTPLDYKGASVLHEGTWSFSSIANGGVASAIGASEDYAQNWIWDGGTWEYTGGTASTNRHAQIYQDTEFNISNKSTTVTMNGSVDGTGGVSFGGAGAITVGSPSFFNYDGATVLNGATMNLNYLSKIEDKLVYLGQGKNVSEKLVLAGGTFTTKDGNDNYCTYMFPIEVQEGTTSIFQPYRNCYIKSAFSGSGTVEFRTNWLREYWQGDFSNFYGRLIANGTASSSDCQLLLQNKGIPNGVVELKGTIRVVYWETNGDLRLGGLSGVSSTCLSGSSKQTAGHKMTWRVGGANTDETFYGVIDDRASSGNSKYNGTTTIVKEGSGVWRLAGTNTYSGTTTVSGGKLVVNGKNNGAGNVTVNAQATLAGRGTIASAVTVAKDGTIMGGDTLVNGNKLSISSNLTLQNGAILEVPAKNDGTTNTIAVTGKMTVNNAVLQLDIDASEDVDDSTVFKIFKAGSTSGTGFVEIIPAAPGGKGQEWDTSRLMTEGVLTVKLSSDAIQGIPMDGKDAPKWKLNGMPTKDEKGIFIQNGKKILRK